MGFWGSLVGSDKVQDGLYNGIDKLVLTKEEQLDLHLKFLKAYEPFKLLQRYLAVMVGIPFLLIHLITVFLLIKGATELALQVAELNNNTLGTPFLWIMALYFGGGAVEGSIRAIKGK